MPVFAGLRDPLVIPRVARAHERRGRSVLYAGLIAALALAFVAELAGWRASPPGWWWPPGRHPLADERVTLTPLVVAALIAALVARLAAEWVPARGAGAARSEWRDLGAGLARLGAACAAAHRADPAGAGNGVRVA